MPTTRFLEASPRQSYLCLYNRAEGKRYIVRSETGNFSDLSWLPDSKRLMVMKTVNKGAEAQVHISMVDVPGFTMNQIALLQAKDSQPVQWSETDPQFRLLDISNKAGGTLFVLITEIVGNQGTFGDGIGHLKAITINKELSLDIAQIKNDLGLDWHSTANPVR